VEVAGGEPITDAPECFSVDEPPCRVAKMPPPPPLPPRASDGEAPSHADWRGTSGGGDDTVELMPNPSAGRIEPAPAPAPGASPAPASPASPCAWRAEAGRTAPLPAPPATSMPGPPACSMRCILLGGAYVAAICAGVSSTGIAPELVAGVADTVAAATDAPLPYPARWLTAVATAPPSSASPLRTLLGSPLEPATPWLPRSAMSIGVPKDARHVRRLRHALQSAGGWEIGALLC
jgi:hypothetical protein